MDTQDTPVNVEDNQIAPAMAVVTEALRTDHAYAWGWHCNIAMSMRDEGVDCMVAQRGAARFLQILTTSEGVRGIDTTTFDEYKALENAYNEDKDL